MPEKIEVAPCSAETKYNATRNSTAAKISHGNTWLRENGGVATATGLACSAAKRKRCYQPGAPRSIRRVEKALSQIEPVLEFGQEVR